MEVRPQEASAPRARAEDASAHEVELLPGPAFLETIREDIARSRERVWIETFIVRDDDVGTEIGQLLVEAAARGVDARLLYDPSGSHLTEAQFFDDLEARGVRVRPFGHPAWMGMVRIGLRDHSRLMVIDDHGYTGGHALGVEWAARPDGGKGWEDLSVRVAGPIVDDMAYVYEQRFEETRRLFVSDFDTKDRHRHVRFVSDSPRRTRLLDQAHLEAIASARERLWIAHAYYSPSRRFQKGLYDAARRNVDVRLLLPGTTDIPIIRRAARAQYGSWVRRGIAVFEYGNSVMHSKYALVDDRWAVIGSYQALPTATVLSLESAIITTRPKVVAEIAAHFESALCDSRPVTRADLACLSLTDRILDELARLSLHTLSVVIGSR